VNVSGVLPIYWYRIQVMEMFLLLSGNVSTDIDNIENVSLYD